MICEPGRLAAAREQVPDGVDVVEVTTVFAAMTLVGPQSREVFARFCAADLRPKVDADRRLAAGVDRPRSPA